jgi:hypothetical protein
VFDEFSGCSQHISYQSYLPNKTIASIFDPIPLNLHHNIDHVVVLEPFGGQFHQIHYLVHFHPTKNPMFCWSAQVCWVVNNHLLNKRCTARKSEKIALRARLVQTNTKVIFSISYQLQVSRSYAKCSSSKSTAANEKHMFELIYTINLEPFFLPSGRYGMTLFLSATLSVAKQRWWFYILVQGFIVHVSVKNTLKVWQYLRSKDISQGSK